MIKRLLNRKKHTNLNIFAVNWWTPSSNSFDLESPWTTSRHHALSWPCSLTNNPHFRCAKANTVCWGGCWRRGLSRPRCALRGPTSLGWRLYSPSTWRNKPVGKRSSRKWREGTCFNSRLNSWSANFQCLSLKYEVFIGPNSADHFQCNLLFSMHYFVILEISLLEHIYRIYIWNIWNTE